MRYPKTVLAALPLLLTSCQVAGPAIPVTLPHYLDAQQKDPQAYLPTVVIQHNLLRALNADLPAGDRIESFRLAAHLGADDPAIRGQLVDPLGDPRTPPQFKAAILTFLMEKDYPDMAAHVVSAMPSLQQDGQLHDTVLDWLARHPTPAVLAEVVRLWSKEASSAGPNESRYRQLVGKMTGKDWEQSLLDGLNSEGFTHGGAATGILAARLGPDALRRKITALPSRSPQVEALKAFVAKLDYLPANDAEYAGVVQMFEKNGAMIDDVAFLAGNWQAEAGYEFNIRDFHLLARIARDPLRKNLRKAQLIVEVGQAVNARRHVPYKQGEQTIDDRFWSRAEGLTMADLWNLYLVNDLLGRTVMQRVVTTLAAQDQKDTRTAFGGLIFYRAGQAEATQYVALPGGDDMTYMPVPRGKRGNGEFDFAADQRDCICRFICHFEQGENAGRAGPSDSELHDAAASNYYGLVLTTVGDGQFAAHYFNPAGDVISLGVFAMK